MNAVFIVLSVGIGVSYWGIYLALGDLRTGGLPQLSRSSGLPVLAVGTAIQAAALFMTDTAYGDAGGGLLALLAAGVLWGWWRGRPPRDRKRALRELGAKARARVAALVERMGQQPVPDPV